MVLIRLVARAVGLIQSPSPLFVVKFDGVCTETRDPNSAKNKEGGWKE